MNILGFGKTKEELLQDEVSLILNEVIKSVMPEILNQLRNRESPACRFEHPILEAIHDSLPARVETCHNGWELIDFVESRFHYDFNYQIRQGLSVVVMIPKFEGYPYILVFTSKDNREKEASGEQIAFYLRDSNLGETTYQYKTLHVSEIPSVRLSKVTIGDKTYFLYFSHFDLY